MQREGKDTEMRNFSYSHFTKKQANIIYAAVKRGELEMGKKDINRMYNLVGANTLDNDERKFRGHLERCISQLLEGRTEYAQAELDGNTVRWVEEVVGYAERVATEDDWFDEPGSIIREEVREGRWVID